MMYGIEYEEFPARIAEVAMWLMDHQMNMLISDEFGKYFARLPLKKAAKIVHGNALQIDWKNLIKNDTIEITSDNATVILNEPQIEYTNVNIKTNNLTIIDDRISTKDRIQIRNTFDYILGNPPFVGKSNQDTDQKADMEKIFAGCKGTGVLDYVTAWYLKAAQLIQNTNTKVAFVSTNSISQGEQVGILWNILFNQYKIKIHFAHQTFSWSNEAKGNAGVHVIIVGFANYDSNNKSIFEYENIKEEPHEIKVKNINPYLFESDDSLVISRRNPICNIPRLIYGNKPVDGGFLSFTTVEKNELINKNPTCEKFIRRLYGSDEYINNIERWCLWLIDAKPEELRNMPEVLKRIEGVRKSRLNSTKQATIKLAESPTLFAEIRQPYNDFLIIPRVSSERRKYIPIGKLGKEFIVNDLVSIIPDSNLYHFGILSSIMHMVWVKYVCGRLESRFRYSNDIVYNNYSWPENPTEKQIKAIEEKAQKVLDVRAMFPDSSLADLYNPLIMPPSLVKAHNDLDKAVDLAYRPQAFTSEANRMVYLFELYEKYTADLFTTEKKKVFKIKKSDDKK